MNILGVDIMSFQEKIAQKLQEKGYLKKEAETKKEALIITEYGDLKNIIEDIQNLQEKFNSIKDVENYLVYAGFNNVSSDVVDEEAGNYVVSGIFHDKKLEKDYIANFTVNVEMKPSIKVTLNDGDVDEA